MSDQTPRYRLYMAALKAGDIDSIRIVFDELRAQEAMRPLLFGERKVVQQCREALRKALGLPVDASDADIVAGLPRRDNGH